jgi:O-antigen/teichoic acid export membrane protein
VFVRKKSLRDLRYNERLGIGSQTPWGADEAPDFLIRFIQTGARVVYFPHLFVYHPNKLATYDSATLRRAAGYSRGRGCLFRLHRFPGKTIFNGILRPAMGCLVFLLKCQPMRCAYYFTILTGILRGLLMSKAELEEVRSPRPIRRSTIQPLTLLPLPPQPLVSVLLANYNYERFLPAALDSLLLQTYTNWQAIICDDGSTDHSVQVLEQYCQRDPRIQFIQKSNGGQNSAYNACYREVRGEIICLLDADDAFDLHKLQQVVDAFLANPQAGMCNHFCEVVDSTGQSQAVTMHGFLDCGWLADKALTRGACVYVPTTSCMSIRRGIGNILFPVPPHQERDLDGYLAMTAQFLAPICLIHEKLASYRIHGDNMGGLTQPTPQRLRYELGLIAARTSTVKDFVRQRFSENCAAQIVLEDNPQHIQAALKLLAVEAGDRRPQGALDLIHRHPSAKWRAIWHVIFALPAAFSRSAVPWMHRSYRAKAIVHRFLGQGKVGRRDPSPLLYSSKTVEGPAAVLDRRIAVGGGWLVGARLLSRSVDLGAMLVLAHMLSPRDFGLVAIAMTVIYVVEAALELPVSQALVSLQSIEPAQYDTAFTLSLLRGLALGLIVCLFSWPFARFYGDSRLLPLVCVLCLAPIARGLVSPRLADFSIKLQFAPDFTMEIIGKAAAFLVAVILAITTKSYWAIAAGTVVAPIAGTITSYLFAPYRPRVSLSAWSSFSGFLGWYTTAQAINALNWQTDRLILGKIMSKSELGLFTAANDTATIPVMAFISPINRPLLSAFSMLKEQPQRLAQSYQRSANAIVTLGLPILIGESLLARPAVRLLLGSQWKGSAPLLQWLAISLVPALFALPMSPLAMSFGRTKVFFQRNMFEVCVKLPLVVFGAIRYGFMGVVFARCISESATVFFCMVIVQRLIGLPIHRQLLGPWRSVFSAAVMALVIWLASPVLTTSNAIAPLAAGLLLVVALGAATYSLVLWLLWNAAGSPAGLEAMISSSLMRWYSRQAAREMS